MRAAALLLLLLLPACAVTVPAPQTVPRPAPAPVPVPDEPEVQRLDARAMARNFVTVVADVEPVAERECRRRAPVLNCDFQIAIDDTPGAAPNAFQTVDAQGRPVIAFTLSLIADARNRDELAFIMGHEAAHHVAGHLTRQRVNANAGAVALGGLIGLAGGSDGLVRTAQQIGAAVGARGYSKEFELEADALGTVIAARAGYNPMRGAEYFTRIPDPGDRFLGTHPPNADRIETVRRAYSRL